MPNSLSKETKKALIGASVGLLAVFITFICNLFYNWFSDVPKIEITKITKQYEPGCHINDIDGKIKYFFNTWQPQDQSKSLDYGSLQSVLRKDNCSCDDVNFALSIVEFYKTNCEYSISICENVIKMVRNHKRICANNLSFFNPTYSSEIVKKNREKIINILNEFIINQNVSHGQYSLLFNALRSMNSCMNKRSGILNFQLDVLNVGNSNAVIYPYATVLFRDRKIKYGIIDTATSNNVVLAPSIPQRKIILRPLPDQDDVEADSIWRKSIREGVRDKFDIILNVSHKSFQGTDKLTPI